MIIIITIIMIMLSVAGRAAAGVPEHVGSPAERRRGGVGKQMYPLLFGVLGLRVLGL